MLVVLIKGKLWKMHGGVSKVISGWGQDSKKILRNAETQKMRIQKFVLTPLVAMVKAQLGAIQLFLTKIDQVILN